MTRRARSHKGGAPPETSKITLPVVTTIRKDSFNQDHPSRWAILSSEYLISATDPQFTYNNGIVNDIAVELVEDTPDLVAHSNIYSCNAVNMSASAIYANPFTTNCYMSFRFDPMDATTAGDYCKYPGQGATGKWVKKINTAPADDTNTPSSRLKNCIIGFFEGDATRFYKADGTAQPELKSNGINYIGEMMNKSFSFKVEREIIQIGRMGRGALGPAILAVNSPNNRSGLPVWNKDIVFEIHYMNGKIYFLMSRNSRSSGPKDMVVVDQIDYTIPAGKALYPFYTPGEIPSGPQRIMNFSARTLAQGGGNMPDCTTYCNPTKIYQASSARAVEQQASSAVIQQASSARAVEQQASSARVQQASSARAVAQQASSAIIQQASSAVAQRASAANDLEMKRRDPDWALAVAAGRSLSQGQSLGQGTVPSLLKNVSDPIVSFSKITKGGRRRRTRNTRKNKKSRRRH